MVSGAQRIDRVHGLAVVHLLGAQAASLPGVAADGRDDVRAARARHLHRVAAGDRRDSRRYDWSVKWLWSVAARQNGWSAMSVAGAAVWPGREGRRPRGALVGEEEALPGVGEELFVALRGPAALADEEMVELGGVGGPDDVGGLVGI